MVKEAVQQTKAVISENKGYRQTAPAAVGKRGTPVTSLRDEAASFATIQQRVRTDETNYAGQRIDVPNVQKYQNVKKRKQIGELAPPSPKVIGAHTPNFKPIFECSLLKIVGGPPPPVGCALGQSLAPVKMWTSSAPEGPKYGLLKKSIWVGQRVLVVRRC